MRIKILTFNKSINYGALLQAYSLNKYLNCEGHECLTINYQNPKRAYSQVTGLRKIKSIIWHYTFAKHYENKDRTRRTKNFEENQLNLTEKIYKNPNQLVELNSTADAFIVGSDQVWNKFNNADDLSYFLHFVDKDKIRVSYSASFGTNDVDVEYLNRISDDLKKFDLVSVRENNAVDILKRIGINSRTVLDPVFLQSAEDWKSLAALSEEHINKKYILCYVMPGNPEVERRIKEVAAKLADEMGYEVISIGEKTYSKPIFNEKLLHSCGPIEFISLIEHAEYVITNSFHGTAFSVIFNKQFWTVLKRSNELNGRNVRLEGLLDTTELSDRIHYVDNSLDFDFKKPIDFIYSNKKIGCLIDESRAFLDRINTINR